MILCVDIIIALMIITQRCGDIFTDLLDRAQILQTQTDPNG